MRVKFLFKWFINGLLNTLDISSYRLPMNDIDHLRLNEKAVEMFIRYPHLASSYLRQSDVDILVQCRPSQLHKLGMLFAEFGHVTGIEALQRVLPTISEQLVQQYVHDDSRIAWSTEWFRVLMTMREFRALVVQTSVVDFIPVVQYMGFNESGGYHIVFCDPSKNMLMAIHDAQMLALEFVREQHGMDHDPRAIPRASGLEIVSKH